MEDRLAKDALRDLIPDIVDRLHVPDIVIRMFSRGVLSQPDYDDLKFMENSKPSRDIAEALLIRLVKSAKVDNQCPISIFMEELQKSNITNHSDIADLINERKLERQEVSSRGSAIFSERIEKDCASINQAPVAIVLLGDAINQPTLLNKFLKDGTHVLEDINPDDEDITYCKILHKPPLQNELPVVIFDIPFNDVLRRLKHSKRTFQSVLQNFQIPENRCMGVILVADVTNEQASYIITKWLNELKAPGFFSNLPMVFVPFYSTGNMSQSQEESIRELLENLGIRFIEESIKDAIKFLCKFKADFENSLGLSRRGSERSFCSITPHSGSYRAKRKHTNLSASSRCSSELPTIVGSYPDGLLPDMSDDNEDFKERLPFSAQESGTVSSRSSLVGPGYVPRPEPYPGVNKPSRLSNNEGYEQPILAKSDQNSTAVPSEVQNGEAGELEFTMDHFSCDTGNVSTVTFPESVSRPSRHRRCRLL